MLYTLKVIKYFLWLTDVTRSRMIMQCRGGSRGGSLGSGDPPFQEVSYS